MCSRPPALRRGLERARAGARLESSQPQTLPNHRKRKENGHFFDVFGGFRKALGLRTDLRPLLHLAATPRRQPLLFKVVELGAARRRGLRGA